MLFQRYEERKHAFSRKEKEKKRKRERREDIPEQVELTKKLQNSKLISFYKNNKHSCFCFIRLYCRKIGIFFFFSFLTMIDILGFIVLDLEGCVCTNVEKETIFAIWLPFDNSKVLSPKPSMHLTTPPPKIQLFYTILITSSNFLIRLMLLLDSLILF